MQPSNTHPTPLTNGAVLFTFDDLNTEAWLNAAPLFRQYDAKATFFITRTDQATDANWEHLRQLHTEGHAIGCHGLRHLKAVDAIAEMGEEKYLHDEIEPAVTALKAAGFMPTAFAYPCSQNTPATDALLHGTFRHLRTGTGIPKGKQVAELDTVFTAAERVAKTPLLIGCGIDYTDTERRPADYPRQLTDAMDRAHSRNEVLALYAHSIADHMEGHHIRPDALEQLLRHAQAIGLPAISYDDLP